MIHVTWGRRKWGDPILFVVAGKSAYRFWTRDHKNKLVFFERTLNPFLVLK